LKKEIYIHVGPPKTGTSAIQKWLNENQDFLLSSKILYPTHSLDLNGVSSGNVRAIYNIDENKQLNLNVKRLQTLLAKFKQGDNRILLLSSEFFFIRMKELKNHIPSAKFIAYLRHPIETKESNYNQSVKRHFQTEIININLTQKLPYIDKLGKFVEEFGANSLCLRLYGKGHFKYGNIVSDLLSIFGITKDLTLPTINNSYQFEALEFKRWLNQFGIYKWQTKIDRALQAYTAGTSRYSLIPPRIYIKVNQCYSAELKKYIDTFGKQAIEPLFYDMKDTSLENYKKQMLTQKEFMNVCEFLHERLKFDYYLLIRIISKENANKDDAYYSMFIGSCDSKYKYKHQLWVLRSKVLQIIQIFKTQLSNLLKN
jgi:hypothetical protein